MKRHVLAAAMLIVALATFASADDFRPIFHPPTIGILEALQQDPHNFSTLIGLLTKADLKELRDAKASYTLLAPTNAAFAKLSQEDFARLTNDPKNLRQLLLAHLLPGKVTFIQMFAPDKGGVAKKNVTESLKTVGGGLAYFQCNEHPADPANEHRPLINKKARVLKSDIAGAYAVIQVVDTVLMFEKLNRRYVSGERFGLGLLEHPTMSTTLISKANHNQRWDALLLLEDCVEDTGQAQTALQ